LADAATSTRFSRQAAAGAALVALTPLVVDPGGHHRYVAARFVFVAIAVGAGVVTSRHRPDRRVTTAWLAVLAIGALATLFGVDPLLSLLGEPTRMMGLASVVVVFGAFLVGGTAGERNLPSLADALVAGGAVVVAYGVGRGVVEHEHRAVSTMGNADFLGAYLCVLIPMAAARWRSGVRWALPVLAGAVGLLAWSGTRGAWLGAVAGVAVLAALRLRRWWPLLTVGAVALVVVVLPVTRDTARGRFDTWRETAGVIADRPALGWGPDAFRVGFGRNAGDTWMRRYGGEQVADRAHDRFLDVAATTGLAGLAADIALLVAAAIALRGALMRSEHGWLTAGVAAALAAWVVQGLFLFDTFDVAAVAWVLVGAATATRPTASRWPNWTALPVAALIVVLSVVNVAADRISQGARSYAGYARAARLRPRSFEIYQAAAFSALGRGQRATLESAHRLVSGWDDPIVRLADAALLYRLDPVAAVAEYRAVIAREPSNGRAYLGLAETLFALHCDDAATTALRRAAYLLPNIDLAAPEDMPHAKPGLCPPAVLTPET
jgi:O-antigen ligase